MKNLKLLTLARVGLSKLSTLLIFVSGMFFSYSSASASLMEISFDNGEDSGSYTSVTGDSIIGASASFDTISITGFDVESSQFDFNFTAGDNNSNVFEMTGIINNASGDTYNGLFFNGEFAANSSRILNKTVFSFLPPAYELITSNSRVSLDQDFADFLGLGSQEKDVFLAGTFKFDNNGNIAESDIGLTVTSVPSTGSTISLLGLGFAIIGVVARRNK